MTNKPLESFYAGNVEVAVWENQGEDSKIFYSVTAKRSYMDTNGQWKDAGTVHLLPQQIPDMVMALQKSHEFLRMGMRQKRKQPSTAQGVKEEVLLDREAAAPEGQATETQSELAVVNDSPQGEGFRAKVGSSRGDGSKRSR